MVEIKDLTIICVDTKNYGRAAHALKKCMEQVKVPRIVFLTDIDIDIEGVEVIKIQPINGKRQYSRFIIKELYKYFDTSHCLLVQWDGYIINGESWTDDFLQYDYIGAPWLYTDGRAVGNGGMSARSKKLQTILGTNDFVEVTHPEDEVICRTYGNWLERIHGIRIATEDVAERFSYELRSPIYNTFGFHGFFHPPYQPTIVIKRSAALGDVVQVEPVLAYFFKKGYRVVLETLPQFQNLFIQHYFKVHQKEQIDQRHLHDAKVYDLDFSYESKPRQLHLKTYFEFCEVPESEMILRNPILSLNIEKGPHTKLFKKYCVIHIPDRKQTSRNIQGNIDWPEVVKHLRSKGYDSIQLSGGEDIEGALRMQTPGEPFLMWVLREADLFLGIDSGPGNIAVAFNVPAILFFGSVNPEYIYADLSNIEVIQHKNVCRSPYCWSATVGCEGTPCIEDEAHPPCVQFTQEQVINAINKTTSK